MRNRNGVSVIEVMVALVLFGMIATVHTVATMRYSLRERVIALGAARSASVATAIDLYSAMPRGLIASNTGCTTINTWPNFPHTRCVTTAAVSGTVTRITIVITPTNTNLVPVTVTVDRVTSNTTPPFS
jgi:prepilin-type N-terminal cleavage/methylation domain-containing protein